MHPLKLANNISRLRHEKHVTQEALADFVGVTKASVSKWETEQSMPDIMILPQLAAFFDVTIDELMGYEPQLSHEQIQKIYYELAGKFANEPYDTVMAESRKLVKEYYSCYTFLFQICCLWLNHYNLAGDRQGEVLADIADLCIHILENSKDIELCYDVKIFKATVDLLLGDADAVIDNMENIIRQCHMAVNSETTLIQAYIMKQDMDKAMYSSQIGIYIHVMSIISCATKYLEVCADDMPRCEELIRRICALMDIFNMDKLHPNASALFFYNAAIIYCTHNNKYGAVEMLEKYADELLELLKTDEILLRGDSFFDYIEEWYKGMELGGKAPRDKKLIWASAEESFEYQAFGILSGMEGFEKIKLRIKEARKNG